jgi:peptidoglycan/LPS O-acetylase OafA/YrhL
MVVMLNSSPDSRVSLPMSHGRIPSLDGVRAIAVALVLLAHACQTHGFPATNFIRRVGMRGAIGVEVFFVISGFLITTLMLREMERTGAVKVKAFYTRRILRILPAYASFMVVLFLLSVVGPVQLLHRDWIGALTYTVNFLHAPTWEIGHIWSLSIEEHFYLIWPLVIVIGGAVAARRVAMFFIVACFVFRWLVLLAFPRSLVPMADLWTFTRLDTIAFGCLLALSVWDAPGRQALDRLASRNSFVLAGATALAASMIFSSFSAKFAIGIAYTINSASIAFLLWCAVRRNESLIGRLLNGRVLVMVGVGSYSLYLWQQIFLNPHKDAFINRFPQNLIFACAAAATSYLLIEKPFLRLKDRSSAASLLISGPKHGALIAPRMATAGGEL